MGGSQLQRNGHRGGGVADGCAVGDRVVRGAAQAVWQEVVLELAVGDCGAIGRQIRFHYRDTTT